MATLKDVVALANEEGYASAHRVAVHFGLSHEKACRVIEACWKEGLLVPTTRSYFAIPGADGRWPDTTDTSKSGLKVRQAAYREEIEWVRATIRSNPERGITVNDLRTALEVSAARARATFGLMEDLGELIPGEASAGGMYGRRAKIWGVDEQAINNRDLEFLKKAKAKRKKKPPKRNTDGLVWETGPDAAKKIFDDGFDESHGESLD